MYETDYLTEKMLGEILSSGKYQFINNRCVPNSGRKFRPDFRCDDIMLIVEYDGFMHFTEQSNVLKDNEKNAIYESMGYTVIRIPYFVQLTKQMYDYYFTNNGFDLGVDENLLNTDYPHGFIDKRVHFPAEYCLLGLEAYDRIVSALPRNVIKEINYSLHEFDAPYDMKFPPKRMLRSYGDGLLFSQLDWLELTLGDELAAELMDFAINEYQFEETNEFMPLLAESGLDVEVGEHVTRQGRPLKCNFYLPIINTAFFIEEAELTDDLRHTWASTYYMEEFEKEGYEILYFLSASDSTRDKSCVTVSEWLINNIT